MSGTYETNPYSDINMTARSTSQVRKVRDHLLSGKSISPLDAQELYGCMRLAAIIFILKGMGYRIRTDLNEQEPHYGIYSMIFVRKINKIKRTLNNKGG